MRQSSFVHSFFCPPEFRVGGQVQESCPCLFCAYWRRWRGIRLIEIANGPQSTELFVYLAASQLRRSSAVHMSTRSAPDFGHCIPCGRNTGVVILPYAICTAWICQCRYVSSTNGILSFDLRTRLRTLKLNCCIRNVLHFTDSLFFVIFCAQLWLRLVGSGCSQIRRCIFHRNCEKFGPAFHCFHFSYYVGRALLSGYAHFFITHCCGIGTLLRLRAKLSHHRLLCSSSEQFFWLVRQFSCLFVIF